MTETAQAAHRRAEAIRLNDEPLLNEALARMEKAAIEEMMRLPRKADRQRRMLLDHIRVIRGFKSHLAAVIANADQALRKPIKVA